jgi:hypothetical protein
MISRQVNIRQVGKLILSGTAGPPRRSPDFLAASIGNNILGQLNDGTIENQFESDRGWHTTLLPA